MVVGRKRGEALQEKEPQSRGSSVVSLSLPLLFLVRVLLTLLAALLPALLLVSGLALLRLMGLLRLVALSGLRITFAALSLLCIFFVCHGTHPFVLVALQGVTFLRVSFDLSSCFELARIRVPRSSSR